MAKALYYRPAQFLCCKLCFSNYPNYFLHNHNSNWSREWQEFSRGVGMERIDPSFTKFKILFVNKIQFNIQKHIIWTYKNIINLLVISWSLIQKVQNYFLLVNKTIQICSHIFWQNLYLLFPLYKKWIHNCKRC